MQNTPQNTPQNTAQNTAKPRYLDRASPPHISTLILITGLSALVLSVFLPALPEMAEHFGADYRLMQLSLALYLGASALIQLFIGPISDRFGRRPVMLSALALFLLATLGCILAPNITVFLAFRTAQAVIAINMALSRAVVRDMVPDAQAASMIGYVTMAMSLAPMVGPFFGGFLSSYFGWTASFWLLLILGCMVLVLAWRDLGETATTRSTSFAEQFRQYPELLLSRRFWGYCLSSAFAAGAFFAYLGGAAFIGSELFGMNSIWIGLSFGAVTSGYMLGNFISGRFSIRFGINRMILAGTSIATIGIGISLLLFLAGLGSAGVFFSFMVPIGLGNGMTLPNTSAGMLSVRPHLAGTAAGLGGAILIGGGAALSAISGAFLTVESGALPLLVIMTLSSAAATLCILYVIGRERQNLQPAS